MEFSVTQRLVRFQESPSTYLLGQCLPLPILSFPDMRSEHHPFYPLSTIRSIRLHVPADII